MVKSFDACEADFFGDLAEDTHGLWEVFAFVRLHYPDLSERQVFERGRDYITRWITAGWIQISDTPLLPSTITSLSAVSDFLQQHGSLATRYLENSPSIQAKGFLMSPTPTPEDLFCALTEVPRRLASN